jgi:hypothetical protein
MLKDASRAGNAPAPLRRLGKVWSPGDAIGLLTAAPDPPGSGALRRAVAPAPGSRPTSTTNSLGLRFLAGSKGSNALIASRVARGNFQVAFKCAQLALDRDDEQEIIGRRLLELRRRLDTFVNLYVPEATRLVNHDHDGSAGRVVVVGAHEESVRTRPSGPRMQAGEKAKPSR